jgi:hypothetical protein
MLALAAPALPKALPKPSISERIIQAIESQNATALDRETVGTYEFQDRTGLERKVKAPAILEALKGCRGELSDPPNSFLSLQLRHIAWTCPAEGQAPDPCRDPVYDMVLVHFSDGYLVRLSEDSMLGAYLCHR